jgi:hypothetical protein
MANIGQFLQRNKDFAATGREAAPPGLSSAAVPQRLA